MNKIFLEEVLGALISAQQELSKNAENSANLELNRIIEELKQEIEKDTEVNARDILTLIGKVLEKLPSIVRLIELLSS